ncbi:extracellular solute-binding protein [Chelatococcus sp. SYSU_G07232]|uniref:Extracellular solute-binding protein n=1 Tax=Chelatococcus albus TaxID=3047466 RepID=A0ABT7AE15_9HYPH|nr:extracellular solute-binding protein [Chelatococcus sp. SYSU_G07232]MDJ1157619.1 extracellular solute-binding protein [Chelatococcus sp. SYSU_G07232]
MTSFPASFYEPVRDAFEARHPGLRLRVVNRKTTAGVATLIDRSRETVDVFWASATDAFALLAAAQRLAPAPARPHAVPARIGGFPIDDPGGLYRGFALSGYGIVWNRRYLDVRGLGPPQSIVALRNPAYAGHIGMTAPSRSGTTHLMVEALLQQQGWREGWATWIEIGGNLATVTARSFGVGAGVAQGRFGIGLSIDFLGRAGEQEGEGIRFAYPAENVFLPGSVAVLRDAPNRQGAEKFIAFLLSEEGQRLLVSPGIGRLPVDPAAYAEAPGDYANPYRMLAGRTETSPSFDAALSGRRYELVNLLFDEAITYRLQPLQELWRRLHGLEALVARSGAASVVGLLARARQALTAVPVSPSEASDAAFVGDLRRLSWGVTPSPRQAALVADWRIFFEARLAEAKALVAEAEAAMMQEALQAREPRP